jgi:hypothetical protein
MVENHTRDLLQMKAKETALARSRNDVELSQAALLKAQREVEALRTQGQGDAVREVEMWKHRTERAEQRILEREELDQGVMTRLSDLEEFIRGLDDEADGGTAQRLSGRCKLLEEQNRRLLTQMDEYSGRINTLEEVPPRQMSRLTIGNQATNNIPPPKRELVLLPLIRLLRLGRRKRKRVR